MGDEGLERTGVLPSETPFVVSECAHLCATVKTPSFVAENGLAVAWERMSPEFQRCLSSLPPEVLAALHALFSGLPQRP
jgi:hypothetical protein